MRVVRSKLYDQKAERDKAIRAMYQRVAEGNRHFANRPGMNLPVLPTDPVERIVALALIAAHIEFVMEGEDTCCLDFYLPAYDLHIECKQFHTPRISEQMARAPNVIAIQGMDAARAFADMIAPARTPSP